ncbi:hypothetical protein GQX74_010152 [Glossina fuscipes]|nr:hypothetical protein GQX74_010152 [Glossina fuscipes]
MFFLDDTLILKPGGRNTTQKVEEKLKDSVLALQVGYADQQNLERIYNNALREYLWRRDFRNLDELLDFADDLECIAVGKELREITRKQPRYSMRAPPREEYRMIEQDNRSIKREDDILCWRCGQRGHYRQNCRNALIIFCHLSS